MAKKKKRASRSKKKQPVAAKHTLPDGFWQQTAAVLLIVASFLILVAMLGQGGPFPAWALGGLLATFGVVTYVLPLLFFFVAVAIFRAENNKLPGVMKFAAFLLIVWLTGLAGTLAQDPDNSEVAMEGAGGGLLGWIANQFMLMLVSPGIGSLVYVVLIAITLLFVLRLSPQVVLDAIKPLFMREKSDTLDLNASMAARAAKAPDARVTTSIGELKLNEGVPTVDRGGANKKGKLQSMRQSSESEKPAENKAALTTSNDPNWEAPSLELLEKKQNPADAGDIKHNAQMIKVTLGEFGIEVDKEGANIGPKVTQYTLKPPSGVKLTRTAQLESNIALNLAARAIRIEAPIPGQRAVGIEVPNERAADVRIRGILESDQWRRSQEPLGFAVGKDISGQPVVGELNKMPHFLIAGQTNSGKSVMINTLLCSLLYKNSPSKMKLILVDPKQVEMARYQDIPHLLTPIITNPEKTVSALKWAVNEMERRYELLAEVGELNISDYNSSLRSSRKKIPVQDEDGTTDQAEDGEMPYIVIIIDEMADLMMVAARDVENYIVRLAQKARAVGIHLVLATQSPRADVITGLIKANIPAKIAFTVGNQLESRIILDQVGAEKLLGQGDMLYKTATMGKPIRVQGAWVMNEEVKKIADHLRMQRPPQYNDEITAQPVQLGKAGGNVMDFDGGSDDDMFKDAVRAVIEGKKASTSYLQRKLRIGYGRAARIMEEMEEQGIIGAADGNRPREILVSSPDDVFGDSESM